MKKVKAIYFEKRIQKASKQILEHFDIIPRVDGNVLKFNVKSLDLIDIAKLNKISMSTNVEIKRSGKGLVVIITINEYEVR